MPTKQIVEKYGTYKNDLRTCKHCGAEFYAQRWNKQQFCSHQCGVDSHKGITLIEKLCPECGEIFESEPWRHQKFCSVKCRIKYKYNGYFKMLDSPDKAYWFGFIVGDGSIGFYGKYLSPRFSMTLVDHDHLCKLAACLGYDDARVKMRKYGGYSLQLVSGELVKDLQRLGLTPRKADTVDASIMPKRHVLAFIRGLIDADGSIGFSIRSDRKALDPYLALYGNAPLLLGVKAILGAGVLTLNKKRSGRADALRIGGRFQLCRILASLYPPGCIALDRKENKAREILAYKPPGHTLKYSNYINGVPYLERRCLVCNKNFLAQAYHAAQKLSYGRYCSVKCAGRAMSNVYRALQER